MSLDKDQLAAAVDLLRSRIRDHGGTPAAAARALCDGDLRGWVTAGELLAAYRPEAAPSRWVDGDHDRDLDYYDPQVLIAKADAAEPVSGCQTDTLEIEREAIARILRRLESGGGLLRRKVRWRHKYYTLQPGESAVAVKSAGEAQCGGRREEWLCRAVLIKNGDRVVKIFQEARLKRTWPAKGNSRKPVAEIVLPELDMPELGLRRIAMNVAVLLKRLRGIDSELRSAAAIARAAGMTRANVSARQIKMEAEEREEGAGLGSFARRRVTSLKKRGERRGA